MEKMEREKKEQDEKREKERNEQNKKRLKEEATREAEAQMNVKLSQYGFCLGCTVTAKCDLTYEKDGTYSARKGDRGTIKSHACDASEDSSDNKCARASVDWAKGNSSRTAYTNLERV